MRNAVMTLVAGVALTTSYIAYSQRTVKSDIYNRIVVIKGRVEIMAPDRSGPLRGSGIYLVFQREGCNDCLVATHADAEGDYKILVGRGRYKLIVYNPSPPTYDLIAPGQARYVDADPKLQDTKFDIKLVVPSAR